MKRAIALTFSGAAALALAAAALSTSAGPEFRCLAAPVTGSWVHAGPFRGGIAPGYDVVDGRFRLRVGAYRDRGTGLTQKIPWFIPLRYRVGGSLRLVGHGVRNPRRTFTQTFQQAYSSDSPDEHVFPSIVKPPKEGCWRLSFRSGRISGALTVLVRNG